MNDQTLFRRITAILAVVSGPVAWAAFYVLLRAVAFDFEMMADTAALVSLGAEAAEIFRWGEVLGTFGYYLLLVPAVIFLWQWLRLQSSSLIDLFAVLGLAYLFIGAIGGVLRASVLPAMMMDYATASVADQAVIAAGFRTMTVVIFIGIGTLEALLGGFWLLGNGLVLKNKHQILGYVTVILGLANFGYGAGEWLRIELLINLGALAFLIWPLWAMWLGIVIWRHDEKITYQLEAATAV